MHAKKPYSQTYVDTERLTLDYYQSFEPKNYEYVVKMLDLEKQKIYEKQQALGTNKSQPISAIHQRCKYCCKSMAFYEYKRHVFGMLHSRQFFTDDFRKDYAVDDDFTVYTPEEIQQENAKRFPVDGVKFVYRSLSNDVPSTDNNVDDSPTERPSRKRKNAWLEQSGEWELGKKV